MLLTNMLDKYAPYVWSSYALALIALVWIAMQARLSWQRELKRAQRRLQAAQQDDLNEQGK